MERFAYLLIDQLMTNPVNTNPIHILGSLGTGNCAIFLDRDGVINEDYGYVGSWNRFKFIDGAIEGIIILNKLGYRVFVVTNQSGIGRGLYTKKAYFEITKRMLEKLATYGAQIDAVYACPHFHSNNEPCCDCRKPKPGMILAALKRYNLSADLCYLVGDNISDIDSANAAGIYQTALIRNLNKDQKEIKSHVSWHVSSLIEFANMLKNGT